MAFRKKAEYVLTQKPDILVVIECEHPDKLLFNSDLPKPTDTLWFGKNKHKGIAIFSYGKYKFKIHEKHNENFKLIIPIEISGGNLNFILFIVWAYNPEDKQGKYITQVWKAISYYDDILSEKPVIFIGDFNSNTIWDFKKHRLGSHSEVVKMLEEKGIVSLYHFYFNQTQGMEKHPTFYMYRHQNKPYHIDYCFVSNELINKLNSFEIGGFDDWIKHSDHAPLITTFDF